MSKKRITIQFIINDKEKFKEFHGAMLEQGDNETKQRIGADLVISSWSDPFAENDILIDILDIYQEGKCYINDEEQEELDKLEEKYKDLMRSI